MNTPFVRAALQAVLFMLLTAQCALGATLAQITGKDGLDLHWDVVLLSFVICTVSGVAALLQRVNAELKANPDHQLPHPWVFCGSHIVGSWAAGFLAFVSGQMIHADVWASLALMIIASYAGARYLEAQVEAKLPKPTQEAAP